MNEIILSTQNGEPVASSRQTAQGLCWALKFVCQLQTAYMSEKELKHAIRLTHFRGTVCPEFQA